jgi:hypothetical protein
MRVKIEIIKDHESGLKTGDKKLISKQIADELVEMGLAKIVGEEDKTPVKIEVKKVEIKEDGKEKTAPSKKTRAKK